MTAKSFGEKNKPFFADKGLETNNIIVKEKNKLITNISLVLIYSINIVSTLQSSQKFLSIPNLLIHHRDYMSIKKKRK